MTKRSMSGLALAVATALLVVASQAPATAGHKPSVPNDDFAKCVAGSYLMDLDVEVGGVSLGTLKALFTFGADGTIVSEDVSDFGGLDPAGGFESSNRGNWRQAGRHELTFTAVGFIYASNGALVAIGRLPGKVRFNRNCTNLSSRGRHELLPATEDPLDPNALVLDFATFSGSGRRIPAVVE